MCFFIVDGEKQGQALHGSLLSKGPQGRVHPHHEATRDIASVRDISRFPGATNTCWLGGHLRPYYQVHDARIQRSLRQVSDFSQCAGRSGQQRPDKEVPHSWHHARPQALQGSGARDLPAALHRALQLCGVHPTAPPCLHQVQGGRPQTKGGPVQRVCRAHK